MSEPISAYPLCWPAGWKRSALRRRSRFANVGTTSEGRRGWQTPLTVAQALKRVIAELGRMGVGDWNIIVSTNVQTRRDGLPYSNQAEPKDPGAAVYWKDRKEQRKCMAIDSYIRVADNLAAIAATIAAMRAIERHGGAEILDRAFVGFQALPPPIVGAAPWWQVLKISRNGEPIMGITIEDAEAQYRKLARQHHPDRGGDPEKMAELNEAIRQARDCLRL